MNGSGTSRKEIDEVFKGRVEVARAFKSKRIAHPIGVRVVFEVVRTLFSKFGLSSLSVCEFVREGRR